MRLKQISSYIVTILLVLYISAPAIAAEYFGSHSKLDPGWRLSLPASLNGKIYITYGPALEIIQIICEGTPLEGTEIDSHVDDDITSFSPGNHSVIYSCNPTNLRVHIWKNGSAVPNKIRAYSISADSSIIQVKYRVHSADGAISEINSITSFEINNARRKFSMNQPVH